MDFMMELPVLDLVLKLLLGIGAAIGFVVGLRQYAKAQTWKRHEFVAAEIRNFTRDHLTRNAMLMLDWGTRQIELFPTHDRYSERHVMVTRPTLYRALVTHDKVDRPYTDAEAAIRDSFDAFFARLERFEHFMAAGLVESEEFKPHLRYWIRVICDDVGPDLHQLLSEYVAFYRFDGVPALFKRYGRSFGRALPPETPRRQEIAQRYDSVVEASRESALADQENG